MKKGKLLLALPLSAGLLLAGCSQGGGSDSGEIDTPADEEVDTEDAVTETEEENINSGKTGTETEEESQTEDSVETDEAEEVDAEKEQAVDIPEQEAEEGLDEVTE